MNPIHLIVTAALAIATPAFAQAQSGKEGFGRPTVDLRVCNSSGYDATVAVSYVQPGEETFINRGWYDVENGACRALVTTDNANFYLYADASDGSGRSWKGDHTLCVEYPGPYTFYSTGGGYCTDGQDPRDFLSFTAEEPGEWTWTLDP